MKGRRLLTAMAMVVVVAAPTPPSRPDVPVLELHRTAQASHFEKDRANPLFILVIGSDVREGDPARGRADSLHIVAINTKTRRGTIVGIPRDSYVPVAGRGRDKINASLFFGGAGGVVATVSALTRLPIHYWALIEFSRFRHLVELAGPVEVNVPYPMNDALSGAFFPAGPRKMGGVDALAFARVRKGVPGGDFGRSENQGRLLLAGLKKFRADARDPFKVLDHLLLFTSLVRTNVGTGDLLRLASLARGIDPAKVRNIVLPGSTGSAGGSSVVFLAPGWGNVIEAIRTDAEL